MSFKSVLKELVSSVKGADGAIFLEGDGEAVEWYCEGDGMQLKLRAAYVAVVLQASRSFATHLNAGSTKHLIIGYEGAKFIIQELESGYFLVLVVKVSANVGEALYRMKSAVTRLRQEIDS